MRRGIVLLAWYFLVGAYGYHVVGPFPDRALCARAMDSVKPPALILLSCWEVKP